MLGYLSTSHPLSVLVVDDEPDIRLMLRAALKHHDGIGFVSEAIGGLAAVAQATETNPDAIVLDLRMPDIDGLETARRIKHDHPDTKIILFSAYLSDGLFEEAAAAGVDLCLPKTTTPKTVGEMIINLCA